MKKKHSYLVFGALLASVSGPALAAPANLVIESWRNDDLTIWQDQIIPAFEKTHPDIKVNFAPTAPKEYDGVVNAKLDAGTAGDIITCRPFDQSLNLYKKNYLAALNDLPGLSNFSDIAKAGWSTDDGKTTFCVPIASVIHGFFYNKDIFKKLDLKVPTTQDEFFAVLDKIKADGNYTPMALGTNDQWESATMGYQNIGPNYWKGEEGRLGLIKGAQKLTDPQFVEPFKVLARWGAYLGPGYKAQSYPDSQNLFTLGNAAIYPTGSWETATFRSQASFDLGVFMPPVPKAGDPCYISDHPDIALGMNPKTKSPEAAKAFLAWIATPEFAEIYSNALPGFFSLGKTPIKLKDPLAEEFVSWRGKCKSTMRSFYQILSRGTPNEETEAQVESANVISGTDTPEQAAKKLQGDLDSWYKPQK
jgi:raffinose/stachyose/melibiose transport system substrate-binding protein